MAIKDTDQVGYKNNVNWLTNVEKCILQLSYSTLMSENWEEEPIDCCLVEFSPRPSPKSGHKSL